MPARIVAAFAAALLLGSLGACARFADRQPRKPLPGTLASANLTRGRTVFASRCAVCHGVAGAGAPIGPALRGERGRRTFAAVIAIVRDPVPPMPKLYPARMSAQDVLDVAAFVESL